ncbi:MAG: hypothetical protein L3J89_00015 [Gammaproteobacteria bacterium]|nr:hypothetical protein [Gammaproteobacteria bacterium]
MLKWLGGIVTVISLCVGTITLSRHYIAWEEKRVAISELINAAEWLKMSEAYSQAWQVYEEALILSPGLSEIRKGQYQLAKRWLRDFKVSNDRADKILNRITVVLYRSVNEADKQELSTILAHIAWVQVIRARYSLAASADVDSLFEQALRADPNNIYANAMGAHWLLRKNTREITAVDVKSAGLMFSLALQGGMERKYVRQLQLDYLTQAGYESGHYKGEPRLAILSAMLNAFSSMMKSGEPKPGKYSRRGALSAYGSNDSGGENVEASIEMLPAKDHLEVIDWLLFDLDYRLERSRKGSQIKYLRARLMEVLERNDDALNIYRALMKSTFTSEQLDQLVNSGIERLTGVLPARATARGYLDDPVDKTDLWGFHSDTLAKFPLGRRSMNYRQAFDYFTTIVKERPEMAADLVALFPGFIERTKVVTTIRSEHFDSLRRMNAQLILIYARALKIVERPDAVIAALSDVLRIVNEMKGRNMGLLKIVLYELAIAYTTRLESTGEQGDIIMATDYLKQFVEQGGVGGDIANWDDIKGPVFAELRQNDAYKALIRGR